MHKTLIVTNDFPPRPGGIQAFVHNMAVRQPAGSIVVYASTWRDGTEVARFDAEQPFPVIRDRTKVMVPTPRVTRRAAEILRAEGCDSVWFGAAAPLGLMAPALRRAGAGRLLGMTHGHEAAWAQLPVARQLLRRIGEGTDVLTYLGEYTRSRIAAAVGPGRPRGWRSCRPAWTSGPSTRTPAAPPCASGSGWRTVRWWSASPGWCRARGRTP